MKAQRRSFLKNEATDLLDNKGSALDKIGNEATVGGNSRQLSAVSAEQEGPSIELIAER